MKFVHLLSFTFILPFMVFVQAKDKTVPQLGKSSIKEVIKAMTLEEKAHLVVGMGMRFGPPAVATAKRDSSKTAITVAQGHVIGRTEVKVLGAVVATNWANHFLIPFCKTFTASIYSLIKQKNEKDFCV